MNVKYFKDSDTALLEFSDAVVDETREISENVYVDLDKDGNLVSMTIEHAGAVARLPHVRVEEIDASAPERCSLQTLAFGGTPSAGSASCLAAVVERPYASPMDYRERITIEPGKRGGKPCLRGLRITVYDVLDYLAGGMSEDEILADFPDLEREDIRAALAFAADRERRLAGDVAA